MANDDDAKRNVADYRLVKSVLFEYWYDYVETLQALRNPKVSLDSEEGRKYMQQLQNDLAGIYSHGVPSRNITEDTGKDIMKVQPHMFDYHDKDSLVDDLHVLMQKVGLDMGEQGFLDTRLDEEDMPVDNSDEEIPDMFK